MKPLNYLIIILLFSVGCSKNDSDNPKENFENLYIGTWVNLENHDSVYSMTRANEFKNDQDGFLFKSDGTFVQRANSGGCGTPPIAYVNYPGTWTAFPNDNLFIETEFWGGLTSFEIEIVSIDSKQIVFKKWDYKN